MGQHLRIEDDKAMIRRFLEKIDYPIKDWIVVPEYLDYCLTARIDENGEPLGFLWAYFDTLRSVSIHAAVWPGVRIDWPVILHEGGILSYAVGADAMHVNLDDVVKPQAMRRIVRRAGFSQSDDNPNIMRKELPWEARPTSSSLSSPAERDRQ